MSKDSDDQPKQSGVIAYRRHDGALEFILITSRTRKRWIVPKGNVEKDLGPAGSAEQEAYEEAGIEGRVEDEPFARYHHGAPKSDTVVQIHLMEVTTELDDWPEAHERRRHWFTPDDARRRVFEEELRDVLLQAEEHLDAAV